MALELMPRMREPGMAETPPAVGFFTALNRGAGQSD